VSAGNFNPGHRASTAPPPRQPHRAPGCAPPRIILEPVGRNTAPAAAVAALAAAEEDPDALVLLMPADHLNVDGQAFRRAANCALHRLDWLADDTEGVAHDFGGAPSQQMEVSRCHAITIGFGKILPHLLEVCTNPKVLTHPGRHDMPELHHVINK
jgi:hypothetical protein